jgi:hypothetical protein
MLFGNFLQKIRNINTREIIVSEKNPKIVVGHSLGRPQLYVAGFDYSTRYYSAMWRYAIKKLPRGFSPKKILVLGLALGDVVALCQQRFPKASGSVIEWDPTMIELAKKYQIFDLKRCQEIWLGDAIELLPQLKSVYDLIIVDIFSDDHPDLRLSAIENVNQLSRLLSHDGFLMFNVFKNLELIEPFKTGFSLFKIAKYRFNTISLFRHFGRGQAGDPLPEGFTVPQQSPAFLTSPLDKTHPWELVGKTGNLGLRWHHGPCWFERYYSDEEPVLDYTMHSRLVIWQPVTRLSQPQDWHRWWFCLPPLQHGFTVLDGREDYWKDWSAHAQRHRKDWLKQSRFEIEEVAFEEFCGAYNDSGKLPGYRAAFIKQLNSHISTDPEHVHLFAVRDKEKNRLVAGLAVQDIPDLSQSEHVIAFYHPDYHKTPVNYGLIEHWHRHGLKNHLRFLHFGLVWTLGDPLDWRGYSKFKRQFNLFLLKYPKTFVRIARRRKSS